MMESFQNLVNNNLRFQNWEPCGSITISDVSEFIIITQTLKRPEFSDEQVNFDDGEDFDDEDFDENEII